MEPARKIHPALAALIVIVLIGIVATAVIVINMDKGTDTETTQTTDTTTPASDTDTNTDAVTSAYKDGTYSATGSYSSPGGRESIKLTVTIKDGIIVSTSLDEKASNGEAKEYQDDFDSGYKTLVVGKNIDEVSLSRVAGSSLTSNGFNDALDEIKSDAKA